MECEDYDEMDETIEEIILQNQPPVSNNVIVLSDYEKLLKLAGFTNNNAPKLTEGTLIIEVIEASLFKDIENDGTQMDPFV